MKKILLIACLASSLVANSQSQSGSYHKIDFDSLDTGGKPTIGTTSYFKSPNHHPMSVAIIGNSLKFKRFDWGSEDCPNCSETGSGGSTDNSSWVLENPPNNVTSATQDTAHHGIQLTLDNMQLIDSVMFMTMNVGFSYNTIRNLRVRWKWSGSSNWTENGGFTLKNLADCPDCNGASGSSTCWGLKNTSPSDPIIYNKRLLRLNLKISNKAPKQSQLLIQVYFKGEKPSSSKPYSYYTCGDTTYDQSMKDAGRIEFDNIAVWTEGKKPTGITVNSPDSKLDITVTKEGVHTKSENSTPHDMLIFDMRGSLIHQYTTIGSDHYEPVKLNPYELYILRIRDNNNSVNVSKFIITE